MPFLFASIVKPILLVESRCVGAISGGPVCVKIGNSRIRQWMTKDQIEQLRRHRRRVCASQGHVMHLANIFERGGQYLCRESMYREHSNNLGNHAHSVAATVVNAIYIRCSKSG